MSPSPFPGPHGTASSPQGFRGPDPLTSRRVEPTRPVAFVPDPPVKVAPAPTITISRARRVLLSKSILVALGVKDGQRLDVVPGRRRGSPWELDTLSRTGYPVRLRRDGKGWLTLGHHIDKEHFLKPVDRDALGAFVRSKVDTSLPTRTLSLGPEDPTRPGLYLLLPD